MATKKRFRTTMMASTMAQRTKRGPRESIFDFSSVYAEMCSMSLDYTTLRGLLTMQEYHHVTILHDVRLAFRANVSFVSGRTPRTVREQRVPLHHFRTNELIFEVRMYCRTCFWCRRVLTN